MTLPTSISPTPPRTIMVINGSQELLELFREIVEEFGAGEYITSLHALDDVHTVDVIRRINPELVLVDQPFNDPDMRGWELVQNIRLARDLRTTPVVFMTTNVRLMQDLEAQLAALNIRTMLKPFDPDNLILQIRQALADKRAQDAAGQS
jgi:CheY-like chemotaxis protein